METLIQNILAMVLGMMIFFSFVLAPMIFKILDAENAGKFVRKIFPYYYFVNPYFFKYSNNFIYNHFIIRDKLLYNISFGYIIYFCTIF